MSRFGGGLTGAQRANRSTAMGILVVLTVSAFAVALA